MTRGESSKRAIGDAGTVRRTDPGDGVRRHFRSAERYFCFDGRWYFATREGDRGPFTSKAVAIREMERYIVECTALARFQESRDESRASGPRGSLNFEMVPTD